MVIERTFLRESRVSFMLLELWQMQGITRVLHHIASMVHGSSLAAPPRVPELITVHEPANALRAEAVYGGAIRLGIATTDDAWTIMSFWAVQTLLWWDAARICAVTPTVPCLAFLLYFPPPEALLAWDVRSLMCVLAQDQVWQSRLFDVLGMKTRGPQIVQARRRRALRRLSYTEQGEVLWDVITRDVWEAPERKRVPLAGLLHSGRHAFASGTQEEPYRLLRYLDNRLALDRQRSTVETAEHDLSPQEQRVYDRVAVPAPSLSLEAYVHEITANLPLKQRLAVQHWLYAQEAGVTFVEYCRQHNLPLNAYKRAVSYGLDHLRKKS
jgi:hypothetical protein